VSSRYSLWWGCESGQARSSSLKDRATTSTGQSLTQFQSAMRCLPGLGSGVLLWAAHGLAAITVPMTSIAAHR
jgi:hypothetical protein